MVAPPVSVRPAIQWPIVREVAETVAELIASYLVYRKLPGKLPCNAPVGDHMPSIRTAMARLYDKVKAVQPETTLPPEFAAIRLDILAKEKARQDRDAKSRAKEEAELKEMEDQELKTRPAAGSGATSR